LIRRFIVAVVSVIVLPLIADAGSSKASHQFTVAANYDQVATWYDARRAEILKASNCRILKDEGNGEYLVQTRTLAGDCQYVIRESKLRCRTHDGRDQWVFIIKFVRNVSGWVADQEFRISLTDLAGETKVEMAIRTRISGIRVPVFVMRTMQRRALKGCEDYVMELASLPTSTRGTLLPSDPTMNAKGE
jgi:hypothetical protein